MSGFFSTYAALRLTAPQRRRTLTGSVARLALKGALAPVAAAGVTAELTGRAAIRRHKLAKAQAKLAANQAAAAERRRQALSSTEAHARSFFGDDR